MCYSKKSILPLEEEPILALEINAIKLQYGKVLKCPNRIPYHRPISSVFWTSFQYEIESRDDSYADHRKKTVPWIPHTVPSAI